MLYKTVYETYARASLFIKNQQDVADTASHPRKTRKVINRNREVAQLTLMKNYFTEDCIFDERAFKRRYRMSKAMFLRIVDDLQNATPYFTQKWDARGRKGFSPLQKCTSAIRQLAYATPPDGLDDYLQMSERSSREILQHFCKWVIKIYGKEYLRRPTLFDVQQLYARHESKHGFPGMLGSIDCTHWAWSNCPVAWRGQYMRGDHQYPTLMLEAVASQDLWIWHAFFGVAGSNNDINVLNQSPIFNDVVRGKAPVCPFVVNQATYKYGYYLADGIYPEWATFVKSFQYPHDDKRIKFKKAQEAARKDVERAFGVLKKKWQILRDPARPWSTKKIGNIMYACIILHNMIIQDKGRAICAFDEDDLPQSPVGQDPSDSNMILRELRCRETHNNLRSDLVEHISTLPDIEDSDDEYSDDEDSEDDE